MIVLDSEWWVNAFNADENEACKHNDVDDVVIELRKALYKNLDKTVFLLSHHPFRTTGKYGGKFSLKDHIFPLTRAERHLYLPLPGVGSLYPLFKKAFPNREDINYPDYYNFIGEVNRTLQGYPNIVQFSSHDDGL